MKKKDDFKDKLIFAPLFDQAGDIGLSGDAVSSTEMTGLIPSLALDEFERDSYEDIEDDYQADGRE